MNKLSKILIAIIVILVIALGITIFSYFDMKNAAQENLRLFLNSEKKITLLLEKYPELQDIDIESLETETNE